MRILVLSDSHGCVDPMQQCVELVQPQAILHLGDCARDADRLGRLYPRIPLLGVPGNCDYAPAVPQSLTLELDGVRIFVTHGHLYGVKRDLTALAGAAKDAGARLALFGHTHIQHLEERGGITLLNPGTAGRFGHSGYAVVEIKDGAFSCRLETDTE